MIKGLTAPFLVSSLPAGIKYIRYRFLLSRVLIICAMVTSFSLHGQKINVDSLKKLLPKLGAAEKVNTLNALASAPVLGVDSSLAYANQAFQLAQQINDKEGIITSEYQLGVLNIQRKTDSLAFQHITHALDLALSEKSPFLISVGYLKLGQYYFVTGNARKSLEYLHQSLVISEENNFEKLMAEAYNRSGHAFKALNIYQDAISNYLKALRIFETMKDEQATVARIFNDMGTVYQRTDDYEDALNYFNRALKINTNRQDTVGVLVNTLNIGVIHQKKGNFEEALSYYYKILPITRVQKDKLREAIITGNIGSTLVEQGKLEQGLAYLNQALALKEELRNPKSILHTLNDIADVKVKLRDGSGAKATAERVVSLARQHEEADYLRFGYLNLSKSYRLLKDHERAYYFLEKYKVLNDSLFGIEKAQQINELQIRYDTEKKDMAINALQQEKDMANAQRKIYFLLGTIVSLVLIGLYVHQRLKTKRNQQLLEKEREVDRMKSDFFANISHEFRTPLALILGPIDTILDKTDDPSSRFQLWLMKKNATRLLRLINQILELSKMQAGYLTLRASKFNAVSLIKGVSASFQSMAESKDIRLEIISTDEEISLYGDPEQIETICINLISNAFKFSDAGAKVTVQINRVHAISAQFPKEVLELRVMDTGIGISKKHLDQIFDRFYRVGSSSVKEYGGTGIGLALTKDLVELHKGTIDVTSEPGVGTSVTVRLPLGKAHLKDDQVIEGRTEVREVSPAVQVEFSVTSEPEEMEMEEIPETEKPTILIIDDNDDVRNYVKSILEPQYLFFEAVNGEEGIRQAKAFIPDLIISDVMMPEMNGYDACRILKKDEITSHIPVILLTAKASINSRIEGLETEADLYLNKPFVPRELLLCINNLIQSRKKLRERYNRQLVLKPVDIAINSMDEMFLDRLMKVLEANYEDENFSVEQLSKEIGMSRSQLHRKLHALTNESTSQFIRSFRLQRAMEFLKKNHGSVSEIAFKVGFSNPPYFNKCFLQHYGRTPTSVIEEAVASSPKAS
jgi:signal transduction histidine kinase/DNA-binding response OmpR family regulator